MISAEFFHKASGFVGFKVCGHADYARSGKDIVCASVSSAVMLTANTITDFYHISADASDNNNTVKLIIHSDCDENADRLISSLINHIQLISQEFPKNIKIIITEV